MLYFGYFEVHTVCDLSNVMRMIFVQHGEGMLSKVTEGELRKDGRND